MPTALETATKVYALFGEGKIPEIGELYAEGGSVTWMGDKGKEEHDDGFGGFAAGVLSRIPVEWQGFALDWDKREVRSKTIAIARNAARGPPEPMRLRHCAAQRAGSCTCCKILSCAARLRRRS